MKLIWTKNLATSLLGCLLALGWLCCSPYCWWSLGCGIAACGGDLQSLGLTADDRLLLCFHWISWLKRRCVCMWTECWVGTVGLTPSCDVCVPPNSGAQWTSELWVSVWMVFIFGLFCCLFHVNQTINSVFCLFVCFVLYIPHFSPIQPVPGLPHFP